MMARPLLTVALILSLVKSGALLVVCVGGMLSSVVGELSENQLPCGEV